MPERSVLLSADACAPRGASPTGNLRATKTVELVVPSGNCSSAPPENRENHGEHHEVIDQGIGIVGTVRVAMGEIVDLEIFSQAGLTSQLKMPPQFSARSFK